MVTVDIKSLVTQVDRVFNGAGDYCDFGCHESAVQKMIEYVKENLTGYRYCVIADWVWIDINVPLEAQEQIDQRGLKPCVIFARKVIDDEARRPFQSLRTTMLQKFHQNCIFLSRNTAYILRGSGTRVTIDPLVYKIAFS